MSFCNGQSGSFPFLMKEQRAIWHRLRRPIRNKKKWNGCGGQYDYAGIRSMKCGFRRKLQKTVKPKVFELEQEMKILLLPRILMIKRCWQIRAGAEDETALLQRKCRLYVKYAEAETVGRWSWSERTKSASAWRKSASWSLEKELIPPEMRKRVHRGRAERNRRLSPYPPSPWRCAEVEDVDVVIDGHPNRCMRLGNSGQCVNTAGLRGASDPLSQELWYTARPEKSQLQNKAKAFACCARSRMTLNSRSPMLRRSWEEARSEPGSFGKIRTYNFLRT